MAMAIAIVLGCGVLGLAALWFGRTGDGLSRAQEREQRQLWTEHLDKPLRPR